MHEPTTQEETSHEERPPPSAIVELRGDALRMFEVVLVLLLGCKGGTEGGGLHWEVGASGEREGCCCCSCFAEEGPEGGDTFWGRCSGGEITA